MFSHRRAEARDFAAIMALIHHAQAYIKTFGIEQWQDGYPEPEVIQEDIDAERGWVFIDDDTQSVAGYIVLVIGREPFYDVIDGAWLTSSDRYVTIHRMALDDGFRGTGLAHRMMDFAAAYARENGLQSVRSDTHRGNLAMRGLMEKCGYTRCGDVTYAVNAGDPIRVAYEMRIAES